MYKYLISLRFNSVQLTWVAALFFTTVGNVALWQTLWSNVEVNSLHSLLFFISLPVFFFCLFNLLLTPVLVLPYVRKPLLALLVVISASCSYFMLYYNVLIDRSMIQNVFETNQAELTSYFSIPLLLTIIALGVLPAVAMVCLPTQKTGRLSQAVLWWLGNVLVTVAVLAVVTMAFYKDYASLLRNNLQIKDQALPFNVVRNTNGYLKRYLKRTKSQLLRIVAADATRPAAAAGQRPKLVIVVVGETARAQNVELNGYPRATNPSLSQREDIISFKHVSSCGTATAISLPCMFSRMTRSRYDEVRAATEENLLDILQRTGIHLLWRNNNNGGCKGVCARVPSEDMPTLNIVEQCVNKDGTCYDDVLLHQLSARIDARQGDMLIVLHQLGSHGPTYFERYPAQDKTFSPTCDSNQIQKCTNEALTNTYDNTLVYTDRMLGKTIDVLQRYSEQRDVAMIYVSDHGESLGERGMYLHGTPYIIAPKEQTQVPMVMWFSPTFAQQAHLNLACLRKNADNKDYSHDNLYHSLLGLFDVHSTVYQPELDVFAPCREPIPVA
ncbi:phosphoethanolamine transferase [Candidatus Symbiopectobacterium sp. NZEC151]|uniref:phosphoethanolamine transferase n=2 Tax=unclassified Symbiopectobacterium TaxID=2794573 RepID=UPI002227F512|nr:phosphoethanolamine--lipid A transferase [Candidatus Symbiopectobacterium sp. NZEC151]MCW2473943.1 phosphoethanolamine--lipid A transferase [Candidatus Symbiopectobacterium sp. NZEC151]